MRWVLPATLLLVLVVAAPASADTTLGALYTGPYEANAGNGYGTQCGDTESIYYEDEWPSAGNPYQAPAAGRITSWTVAELPAGATFRLAVLTPSDSYDEWTIERRSATETIPSGGGTLTFPTDLPISAADEIALDAVNVAGQGTCIFPTDENAFMTSILDDQLPDGSTQSSDDHGSAMGTMVNLEATFTTAPEPGQGSSSSGGSTAGSSSPSTQNQTQSSRAHAGPGRVLGVRLARRLAVRALRRIFHHANARALQRCARRSASEVSCPVAWRSRSMSWNGAVEVVRRSKTRWSAKVSVTERRRGCRTGGRCTVRLVRHWSRLRV